MYSASLHRVLIPGGRSGKLHLINPESFAVTAIPGFQAKPRYGGGHDDGPTSADTGRGFLFVSDRTTQRLVVVDPTAERIVASTPLAGGPDYVRYDALNDEVWVTEPDLDRIEILTLPKSGLPVPSHARFIAVPGGPESLVLDATRGRAYTHLWKAETVAIDIRSHSIANRFANGCKDSRGIALDSQHGFLFAACAACEAVVLDVDHGGAVRSSATCSGRIDVVGYSASLMHLYLASNSKKLEVFGVSESGQLAPLGHYQTTGGRCVTADEQGNAWVCSPQDGALLAIKDLFPKSGNAR